MNAKYNFDIFGIMKKSHYNDSFQRVNSHKIIVVGHNTKNERSK